MTIILIKIVNVDVETVDKGNGKNYQVAEVLYDYNGNKRSQKVMSFVNPAVFKTAKDAKKGETYEVNVIKNPQGYNQWNSMAASDGSASSQSSAAPVSSSGGSSNGSSGSRSFETAEERAARQRLIVRQSSLSAALETLTPGAKAALNKEDVKKLAEDYTNWVFEKVDLFDQPNDLDDIPL